MPLSNLDKHRRQPWLRCGLASAIRPHVGLQPLRYGLSSFWGTLCLQIKAALVLVSDSKQKMRGPLSLRPRSCTAGLLRPSTFVSSEPDAPIQNRAKLFHTFRKARNSPTLFAEECEDEATQGCDGSATARMPAAQVSSGLLSNGSARRSRTRAANGQPS